MTSPAWWKGLALRVSAPLRRFPLPMAAGAAGAAAGIVFFDGHRHGVGSETALRALLTCWLGVPLFLTATLVGEGRRGAGSARTLLVVAGALLAACFAGLGGHDDWTYIRFALFLLAAHALLALAPLARSPRGDFRAFNLMLFARMALALLLTHVLFGGLCFALQAVSHLFDLRVPKELYGDVWFVLLGVLNTGYLLAGVPSDWARLEGRFPTPLPLDVLARLVLLPLSVLYLAILYVYSVKILIVHQWPRGWVSAPIVVFAAIGMLTVLLLDPERAATGRAVRAYCRGFFVALLPLVVLLFLAISRRAFEYGLTEERCLVYAIAVFLALIAPYFVLSRARHLWAIPLVLAAIAMLTAVGPLSARSLAVRSQTGRLRGLLARNGCLAHGVLVPAGGRAMSRRDEDEVGAALGYLESRHALAPVLAWRPIAGACPGCGSLAAAQSAHDLTVGLGLRYRSAAWRGGGESTTTRVSAPLPEALHTTGFDVAFPRIDCGEAGASCHGMTGPAAADWAARLDVTELVIIHAGRTVARVPLGDLEQAGEKAGADNVTSPLVRECLTDAGRCRLYVSSLVFDHGEENGPVRITSLAGALLLQTPQ